MENNATITIRLPESLKEKIEFVALANCVTVSQVVRDIINDFFDWKKDQ